MKPLFLYNTLTRKKEEFTPLAGKKVKLYTCGPTVYNYAHIGNLRAYIFEDVLKRILLYNGYHVKHVMNITDVGHLTDDEDQGEDKVEKTAREQKKSAWEIADFFAVHFKKDLKLLNILEPDIWCKATDHIAEQIDTIKKIERAGYAYRTSDGIYFDTSKLADYGALARLDNVAIKPGARVGMGEKKHPTDFALWKFSRPDEKRQMEWNSPWGRGFPGWHIECSAMATTYLGVPFDIHCGGIDHIAVHHTNEIAQTKAAEGKDMARFWMHVEFLTIKHGRMGKSEGNFIALHHVIEKGFNPLAFRYLALNTHYRQKLNFSWEALRGAQNALNKLYLATLGFDKPNIGCAEFEERFKNAVNDDLNTPQALAVVWDLIKSDYPTSAKAQSLYQFDSVLGLNIQNQTRKIKNGLKKIPQQVTDMIEKRDSLRKEKKWEQADALRKEIEHAGYWVEDDTDGTRIVPKSL